jgi:hypothetical protein
VTVAGPGPGRVLVVDDAAAIRDIVSLSAPTTA